MKIFKYSIIFSFLVLLFSSCSDESIRLFHEREPEPPVVEPPVVEPPVEPEYYWLLEEVDYPEGNTNFTDRNDQKLTYTDNDLMRTIKGSEESDYLITIDRMGNKISYSRIRESESTTFYDSLLVILNNKKQVDYALHVIYSEKKTTNGSSKTRTQNDSTVFKYDATGYVIKMDHYDYSGKDTSLSYSETYTIENDNVIEILTSKNYRFTYTYDDLPHAAPSEYCYEMPRNTFNMSTSCWFMNNIPFLSEFTGTRCKNNIVGVVIIDEQKQGAPVKYADVKYKYTFDDNDLVSEIIMSGTIKKKEFKDLKTSFSYLRKEKK